MNKSDFTTTALPADFSTREASETEGAVLFDCPTIAPDSLLCPGPGTIFLYDVSLYCEDVELLMEQKPDALGIAPSQAWEHFDVR